MLDSELLDRLVYHPATAEVAPIYDQLRRAAITFGQVLLDLTPAGREQSLAVTALEESLMWASKAVARTTPADIAYAATARVLPDGASPAAAGWTCHRCRRDFDAGISKVMCCPAHCPPGQPVCEGCANQLHPTDAGADVVSSPAQ